MGNPCQSTTRTQPSEHRAGHGCGPHRAEACFREWQRALRASILLESILGMRSQMARTGPLMIVAALCLLIQSGALAAAATMEDDASALAGTQRAAVQQHADALAATGHPVLIVVRSQVSSDAQVQQEAQQLMSVRGVESRTGARDGVVILVDLTPGGGIHGHAAVYVGYSLATGALPQDAVSRIFSDEIAPALQRGDVEAALIGGLDTLTQSVRSGSGPQDQFGWVTSILLPVLTAAVLLALFLAGRSAWSQHRPIRLPREGSDRRPDNAPVLGGALVRGGANPGLNPAVLLELVAAGAIEFSEGDPVQLRRRPQPPSLSPWESAMLSSLTSRMNGKAMSERDVAEFLGHRQPSVDRAIDDELVRRGWFVSGRPPVPWFNGALLAALAVAASCVVFGVVRGEATPEAACAVALSVGLVLGRSVRNKLSRLTTVGRRTAAAWARYGRRLMDRLDAGNAPVEAAADVAALGIVTPSGIDSVEVSHVKADPRWRLATSQTTTRWHSLGLGVDGAYYAGGYSGGDAGGGAGAGGAGAGGSF